LWKRTKGFGWLGYDFRSSFANKQQKKHPKMAAELETRQQQGINIYVGNLPFDTTEDQLKQLCSAHGQVCVLAFGSRQKLMPHVQHQDVDYDAQCSQP
jgi:RNA recognition motif-containing protein